MDEHFCDEFGSGLSFSQSETPNSPCVRQVGVVKRDECWNKLARITELVANLCKNEGRKFHHSFLREHGNSFFRIVSADVSMRKCDSIFLTSLNNPINKPLSIGIVDSHLLAVCI